MGQLFISGCGIYKYDKSAHYRPVFVSLSDTHHIQH